MNARMQKVLGFNGMVIAVSAVLFGTGCGSILKTKLNLKKGDHRIEWSSEDGLFSYEFEDKIFSPNQSQVYFDLDCKEFESITLDGCSYNHFYNLDCLYVEESQQLILNDNPFWQNFFDTHSIPTCPTLSKGYVFHPMQESNISGTITPSLGLASESLVGDVEVTVNLEGGSYIPSWDSSRWQTLNRQLFLFPDGVQGTPDPINMKVSGKPCDVFGYLYEVGIKEGTATVDGDAWAFYIDDLGTWVDVYIGNTLFTSVSLN